MVSIREVPADRLIEEAAKEMEKFEALKKQGFIRRDLLFERIGGGYVRPPS
jgi:ribosomal protein S19E (S16A)